MLLHPFKKLLIPILLASFSYAEGATNYATIMYDGLAIVVPLYKNDTTPTLDTPIDSYTKTPTITGSCTRGTTITLSVDTVTVSPTAKCDANGKFSITITSPELSDAAHEIAVTQTDSYGDTVSSANSVTLETRSYIAHNASLTDRIAVKFLNMATMGSTPAMVQALQQKGVVAWVDEQLAKEWNFKKESIVYNMMHHALKIRPHDYCKSRYDLDIPHTDEEIDNLIDIFLADNDIVFNRGLIHGGDELGYHSSAILKGHIEDDAQLRQRVAFALSQIIVASESTDFFFKSRGEALSYYYDILLKGAFGKYGDVLYDVSLSPAMATYLSYANNRKAHQSSFGTTIYPDENYGREIMQLFSIGLFELNMDGTEKLSNSKRISTYGQQDVMEVSRVFTGLTYPHHLQPNNHNPELWVGDALHPLDCYTPYHDSGNKTFLGQTVSGSSNCFDEVRDTIDILMNHDNAAPFIAKKLILRLTKSNPAPDYVQRVAQVFKNSGGDLGKTVKAVLLDKNIWDDIKNDSATKIKEPYIMYTEMLRAFDVQPWPERTETDDGGEERSIQNEYYVGSKYKYLNEWPTYAPTVFNFYGDSYMPDSSEFTSRGWKAPEAMLLTTKYMTGIESYTYDTLKRNEKYFLYAQNNNHLGRRSAAWGSYMLLDFGNYTEYFKKPGQEFRDGPKDEAGREEALRNLIQDVSSRLLGKQMDATFVQQLVDAYRDKYHDRYAPSWTNIEIQMHLVEDVITPVITEIVMSEEYMTH